MEQDKLISRESIDGYIVEVYEVDDIVGFSVVISDTNELEIDSEDVTIPVLA